MCINIWLKYGSMHIAASVERLMDQFQCCDNIELSRKYFNINIFTQVLGDRSVQYSMNLFRANLSDFPT